MVGARTDVVCDVMKKKLKRVDVEENFYSF